MKKSTAERLRVRHGKKTQPFQMPNGLYFECKTLNYAIKKIPTEITSFTNQIHSLEKLPEGSAAVIKAYKRIISELEKEQKKPEQKPDIKLKQWQPELVERV